MIDKQLGIEKNKMKKIINLIMKKKKIIALVSTAVFLGLFFVVPEARADAFNDGIVKLIGGILGVLISAVGLLLILVIKALVFVASYSNFINSGAVTYGWIMVRDLCNMFFVVVLLIIAFGTILNIESYNYKKWLPKLIMMAVLINFSKTICGLLIDVAQVVMLTFVNSFKDIGGANMTTVLGIDTILKLDKEGPDSGFWQIVGAYLLGLIYIIIALIVITTMMVMLVMRIVMIWIYVVLSPLAYLMAAFPGGKSYSEKWWKDFTSNLIVGPVLAFFIWLSLAALNADQITQQEQEALDAAAGNEFANSTGTSADDTAVAMTESSTPGALIKFVIAIGMLLGGLKISQEMGGAAGSIASKGMTAVNKAKSIGIAGVAGATGYTYAKNVAKNYGAMRQARKQASYQLGAEKLAGGIGAVKKAVGTNVNQALNWSKSKVGLNRAGDRANALNTEAQNKRQQIADIQTNLSRKDGKIGDWAYNEEKKTWQHTSTGATMNQEMMSKVVNKKTETLKQEAETASAAAAVQMKKQQRTDKWIKAGLITAGVGVGLLTGGAGISAALASAAMLGGGVAGAYKGKKKLATMGDYDLSKGSSWRDNQVKTDMENMKDDSDDEVVAKMDDLSLDKLGRAAAAMEAMSRGLLSSEEAQKRKQQIKNDVGADKDGNIKDKKLAARFESIAKTNNVSATKRFDDLRSSDPDKKKKAEQSIIKDIESGKVNIDSLDSGAIKQMGASLASFMKPKEFAKQFAAISSPGKKNDLVNAMKAEANINADALDDGTEAGKIAKENAQFHKMEAMKKIARVRHIDEAVGISANGTPTQAQQEQREKILRSFTASELSDVFTGDDADKKQSIINTFVTSGKNIDSFDKDTQTFLNGNGPLAKDIRRQLGMMQAVSRNQAANNRNSGQSQSGSANNTSSGGSSSGTGSSSGGGRPAPGPAPAGFTWNGTMFVPMGSGGARPNITQNLNNPQPGANTAGGGMGGGPNIT